MSLIDTISYDTNDLTFLKGNPGPAGARGARGPAGPKVQL